MGKQQSNPFSTGAGGPNFETRVQAAFTVFMLTGGVAPCLPPWPISKIRLQGHYAGFQTDDFIVFSTEPGGGREAKLLAQIKHSLSISGGAKTFADVIQAAWQDFNNPDVFEVGTDSLALITGPLSASDIYNVRPILEWARHSADESEFIEKVGGAGFSSDIKKEKLEAFRSQLKVANGGTDLTDDKLWKFLKSFFLIGYDFDTEASGTQSLVHTLIGLSSSAEPSVVWTKILDAVQSANQSAGTVTPETLPRDIREVFNPKYNAAWALDVKKLKDHGDYILDSIRTDIAGVHIVRGESFSRLLEAIEGSEFVFLSGERGCGKSALVKEFAHYMKHRAPVFCLRTEDLDEHHIDDVFTSIGLTSSLSGLETGLALMPRKYLLIESLEKLLELTNTTAFTDLLHFVQRRKDWTVVASGRDYAFQQISINYLQQSGINFSSLQIGDLSDKELETLGRELKGLASFIQNPQLKPLLRNPFFAEIANRVAEAGTQFSMSDGEKEFRAAVWRDVISKAQERTDGMPLRRRKTFIAVAMSRAKQMLYGVPPDAFDASAVMKLEADNLLRVDLARDLVSPAHDVLEDWALEQYIADLHQSTSGQVKDFLDAIGPEPAMVRAFRMWLQSKLRSGDDVTNLIMAVLSDATIQRNWQDETISAVLQSNEPQRFLSRLSPHLLQNGGELLKRFCFILRIACKAPDEEMLRQWFGDRGYAPATVSTLFLRPYGFGWEATILFLLENKQSLTKELLSHVSAMLEEWAGLIHIDKALPPSSREAGLLALHFLEMCKDSYETEKARRQLLHVILRVASAIPEEFTRTVDADVFGPGNDRHRHSYIEELCELSLMGIESVILSKHFPDLVTRLAFHEWFLEDREEEGPSPYGRYHYKDVDESFGLHAYSPGTRFFPASGLKGTFQPLLRFHPRRGLDFIIQLLNKATDNYARSDLDSPEKEHFLPDITNHDDIDRVSIRLKDGTGVKQYSSWRLWAAYRNLTVLPDALKSALMALENWLIDFVESSEPDEIEHVFDDILRRSNSVMPTAVLASVATGFPDKVGIAALPILRSPDFYDLDMHRVLQEMGEKETDWHKSGIDSKPLAEIYSEERRKSATRPWRREHLETLIVRLQFSKFRSQALDVIDDLSTKVEKGDERWRFRFHRIDTRGWTPKEDKENKRILFESKNLEPDLQQIQQKAQEENEVTTKFMKMFLWANKTFGNEVLDQEYFLDWKDALVRAKELLDLALNGSWDDFTRMQTGGIVKAAAVFLRDHFSEMSDEDVKWCAELVIPAVLETARTKDLLAVEDVTDHAGIAAAANVIPLLLDWAPTDEDRQAVREAVATALTHPNKTIRIQGANGIRQHLWKRDPAFAQQCFLGAVEYARLVIDQMQKEREVQRRRMQSGGARLENPADDENWRDLFREQLVAGEISTEVNSITFHSHSSWDLFVPSLVIPDASTDPTHIAFFSRMLTLLFEAEEATNDHHYDHLAHDELDHELPTNTARRFAQYLLSLRDSVAAPFIQQLRDGCNRAPQFISWVLLQTAVVTEREGNDELYWTLWDQFSPKVQEIAISFAGQDDDTYRHDERTKLIRDMLFADTPWQPVDYERQDVALGKDLILSFVKSAGMNPDVFESMASLMFHFPKVFTEDGLRILAQHQEKVRGIKLLHRTNTAYYLERAMNRYLLIDKPDPLSRELHHACRVLLDAVVETASPGAYFLRDHLIRSRRILL